MLEAFFLGQRLTMVISHCENRGQMHVHRAVDC